MAAPTSAAGIAGWYKADDLALGNGATVTTWPEASGVASAGTPTGTPSYLTNATPAGGNAVRFAGAQLFTLTGVSNGPAPISVYMVFRVSNAASGLFGADPPSTLGLAAQVKAGPLIEVNVEASAAIATTGNTVTANTWHRFGLTVSGSAWSINLDGTVTSGSRTTTLAAHTMLLGVDAYSYIVGDVAEFLVYNQAHGATDRDGVIAYLNRWNVAPTLPPKPYTIQQAVNRSYTY